MASVGCHREFLWRSMKSMGRISVSCPLTDKRCHAMRPGSVHKVSMKTSRGSRRWTF